MSIQFNKVTWYSKLGAVILFLLVVPILTFYIGMKYQETVTIIGESSTIDGDVENKLVQVIGKTFTSPTEGTYILDDREVTLVNGKFTQRLPEVQSEMNTRIFGQPVYGDLSGDGKNDAIFFISQETGGTGIFFYAVAAVSQGDKYVGTEGVFLGDRIAPQNINIQNGYASVNYAIRKEGEPMVAQPSVEVSKFLTVRNGLLIEGNVSDYSK